MKCSTEPPPIYKQAQELWGVDMNQGVVLTYGETCHTAQGFLPDWLEPHEEQHMLQQLAYPGGPDAWWKRYFIDPEFRLSQELEAYRVQYQWIQQKMPVKHQSHLWLKKFATDLSSSQYGGIVSFLQAYDLIREKV